MVVTKQSMVSNLSKNAGRANLENSKPKTNAIIQRTKTTNSITDSNLIEGSPYKQKVTDESLERVQTYQGSDRTKSNTFEAPKKGSTLQTMGNQGSNRDFTKMDKVPLVENMDDTAESMCVKLEEWLSFDDLSN